MRHTDDRSPAAVRRYVVGVAVGGGLATTSVALWGPRGEAELLPVAILAVAALLSVWAPLRIRYRGETAGFTFEEAIFIALLFFLPGRFVPLLLAGTAFAGHALRRGSPPKLAFNVGQVALWATAAMVVFHGLFDGGNVLTPTAIVAAFAATLVHNVVNSSLMGALFRRLGDDYLTALKQQARLHVVMWIGNTTLGLLLAFLASQDIVAMLLALPLMIGLYLGYRGYAGVLEERKRNERLHDVTQTLSSATGSREALGRFLRQLAHLLSGERAEIVVIVRDAARYLTVDRAGELEDRTGHELSRTLDEALHGGRALLHSEVDEESNHRDALAAPLVFEDKVIGAVAVYDRHGLEPWDANDVKLLASLANEAAVAVKNVELVADLSEQSRKLGKIVSGASDGIALVDEYGRVVTWNPAFERMTGIRSEEVIGRPWDLALVAEDERSQEQLEHVMRTALAGGRVDLPVDLHTVRDEDEHRWLRCTFAPVDADDAGDVGEDATGVVVIARDVTREREAEELKTDFIATVSHELRTPLTPLKGFLATAEGRLEELDREQLREMFGSMNRQVDRLEALIVDLLTVADLDRGTLALEHTEVDLTGLVEAAVGLLPLSAAARVRVARAPSVRAIGDGAAIGRVVRALLDNALKHTSGMVSVSVRHHGDEAAVSVTDEGPGINEWDHDRIFERFGRLGDHLTRNQGSGLGLAIARSLAERLGGRLELESEIGVGSTFVLLLPTAAQIEAPTG